MKNTYLIDQSEDKNGLVYFIGNDREGPVKIGFTSHEDPVVRLRQLQTASPYKLSVLGFIRGTVAKEQAIHAFLSNDNLRGEWFKREPALAIFEHLNTRNQPCERKDEFLGKLWSIAIEIGDNDWITGETLENYSEPIASITARHVLLNMLSTFRSCNAEKPLPLLTWLIDQYNRDDEIGDLAKDACSDSNFPSIGSVSDYINYIAYQSGYGTKPAVTVAVINAWICCQQAILHIN